MMKRTIRFILVASLILALLVGNSWVTGASFADGESSIGNVLRAWISSMWVQTTQPDFEAGVLTQIDTSSSPGDVKLSSTTVPDWYDGNWSRRAPVDINNPGSGLTNYQVKVDITYDADMQPDFSDIRFLDSDNSTELSHWRESYTASTTATFWVKVPVLPSGNKTIYLYYGNPAAGSASDGWNTFEFFDDFSAGLGQWTIDAENTDKVYISAGAGNPSPSLRHDPDSSQTKSGYFDTRLITKDYQMLDGIIEYEVYLAGTQRIIHQLGWRVQSLDFENGYCWRLQTAAADGGHLRLSGSTSWSTFGTAFNYVSSNTWHSVRELVSGSTYTGYVDGGSAYSGTDSTKLTADYLVSHVHGVSLDASSYVLVDNIRVRQYASTEPTATLGAEESNSYAPVGNLASQVFDSGAGAGWYDSDWSYRREITIDHTEVQDVADPSTTYANFPVLVYATGLSNINANGTDIRFTSSNGTTEIPREIESYAGGTLYAWVKVTLTKDSSDSSDDLIYVYYGNDSATEPAAGSSYGSQNVWTNGYEAVYHLHDNFNDSTGNYNATNNGSVDTTGKVADGQDFTPISEIQPGNWSVSVGSAITIQAWANFDNFTIDDPRIFSKANGTAEQSHVYMLSLSGTGERYLRGRIKTGTDDATGTTTLIASSNPLNAGSWYQVALTYDGVNMTLYNNGADSGSTGKTGNLRQNTWDMKIGNNPGSTASMGVMYGQLDEVRISSAARSGDWLITEYNNQSTPSDFCSIGTEDSVATAIWVALSWDETLQSNTDITFEVRASDGLFTKDAVSPSWIVIGGTSPVTTGLPSGRYMQWRATLTTSDPTKTPTLHEVTIFYD